MVETHSSSGSAHPGTRAMLGILACLLAVVGVPLLVELAGGGLGAASEPFDDYVAPGAIVVAGLAAAERWRAGGRERATWGLFAIAVGCFLVGDVLSETLLDLSGAAPAQPTWVDAVFFAAYPFLFAGVALLVHRCSRGSRRVWLDAAAAGSGLASIVAAIAFDRVHAPASGITGAAAAVEVAYPVLDLVLVGVIVALVAQDGRSLPLGRLVLLAGAASFASLDTVYSVDVLAGRTGDETAYGLAYAVSFLLLAVAAWTPQVPVLRRSSSGIELGPPLLAAACSVGVLVYGTERRIPDVAVVLAAVTLVAAIARTAGESRTLAELARTRREALTDDLTGLANRRVLFRDLERALEARRSVQLALLDLDGFKAYNDQLGHLEGDRLLMRLGRVLAAAVAGAGTAYRLGGDEFCLLVDGHGHGEAVLARVEEALDRAAPARWIGASWGLADLPDEADDADAAVRLADARMYAVKGERASSVRR